MKVVRGFIAVKTITVFSRRMALSFFPSTTINQKDGASIEKYGKQELDVEKWNLRTGTEVEG